MRINRFEFDIARAERQLSIRQLAEGSGVGTRYLCGTSINLNAVQLGKIAKALDVDPRRLVYPEDWNQQEAEHDH